MVGLAVFYHRTGCGSPWTQKSSACSCYASNLSLASLFARSRLSSGAPDFVIRMHFISPERKVLRMNKKAARPRWITLFIFALLAILAVVALALLIQLVPYGRAHTNPPVVAEPNWDSPQTRELAVRACFDCHSNETTWPWYSNIAPIELAGPA